MDRRSGDCSENKKPADAQCQRASFTNLVRILRSRPLTQHPEAKMVMTVMYQCGVHKRKLSVQRRKRTVNRHFTNSVHCYMIHSGAKDCARATGSGAFELTTIPGGQPHRVIRTPL